MSSRYYYLLLLCIFLCTHHLSLSQSIISPAQREALEAFYVSTDGDNWVNNTNWLSDEPEDTWFGVSTDGFSNVSAIQLPDNGLNGFLPPELSNLTRLNTLNLGGNCLDCSSDFYQSIQANANRLSGEVPTNYATLSFLTLVNLSNNELSGAFPDFSSANLIELGLTGNSFDAGYIPMWVFNQSNLQRLYLSRTNREGEIGEEFFNLFSMRQLWLSNNQLSGNIMEYILGMSNLFEIVAANNNFSGTLVDLSNLFALRNINISNNNYTGAVPTGIGNLILFEFLADNNDLTFLPPFDSVTRVSVVNNRLGFASLEPNLGIEEFNFSPQKPLPANPPIFTSPGGTISFGYSVDGENNNYQWFLNDILISGANNPLLELGVIDSQDAGNYRLEVSNDIVPLIISSENNVVYVYEAVLEADSIALADFYLNLDGPAWIDNTNWLSGPVSSWKGVNIINERIVGIELPSNNINGSIPASFWSLDSISFLILHNNNISGLLEPEIGNFASLRILNLSDNPINSQIPEEIMNCTKLRSFDCYRCGLQDTLPEIISLPEFRILGVGGNPMLLVPLNQSFGSNINLEIFNIWNTRPNRGIFPEAVYNLVNLTDLDLSEQQMRGSLSAEIANLDKLRTLYLRSNLMEGDLPEELKLLEDLVLLVVNGNNFTSCPDFSTTSLETLDIRNNLMDFESVIPNIPISNFSYAPMKLIGGNQIQSVSIGSSASFSSPFQTPGTNHQWLFNRDSLSGFNASSIEIVDFNNNKAGEYVSLATHPEAPGLSLRSNIFLLQIESDKSSWWMDFQHPELSDFDNLLSAVAGTKAGDTIFVSGRNTAENFSFTLYQAKTIIGPGYFLEENAARLTKDEQYIAFINIADSADGSGLFGLHIGTLFSNNQSSVESGVLTNVLIEGNKIDVFSFVDKNDGITLRSNYIDTLFFAGTTLFPTTRSYRNILIENNIIKSISDRFSPINEIDFSLENIVIQNNTIRSVSEAISDMTFIDNIIEMAPTDNNTVEGSITFSSVDFINTSGSFSVDSDFISNSPVEGGAFHGIKPYVLSGLGHSPVVENVIQRDSSYVLLIEGSQKGNREEEITSLKMYFLDENGSLINAEEKFISSPSDSLSAEFLPSFKNLPIGENIQVVIELVDSKQISSTRESFPYQVLSASISGWIRGIQGQEIDEGILNLLEIKPIGQAYYTIGTIALSNDTTFIFNDLYLGDYILTFDPEEAAFPLALTSYWRDAQFWEDADTLSLTFSKDSVVLEVSFLPTPEDGDGQIFGVLEVESSINNRVIERTRVANARVTVRRSTSTSRGLDNEFVLVGERFTNENGQFNFSDLIPALYRLRFDLPGVPTDETRNVDLDLREKGEAEVIATIVDGKIVIEEVITLSSPLESHTQVYPNPSTDFLTIRWPEAKRGLQYQLMDFQGRMLENGYLEKEVLHEGKKVDLQRLNKGIYILQLRDKVNGEIQSIRIVKE